MDPVIYRSLAIRELKKSDSGQLEVLARNGVFTLDLRSVSMALRALELERDDLKADFVAACEELAPDGDIPAELRLRWLSALITSYKQLLELSFGTDEDPQATTEMLRECETLHSQLLAAYQKATGQPAA